MNMSIENNSSTTDETMHTAVQLQQMPLPSSDTATKQHADMNNSGANVDTPMQSPRHPRTDHDEENVSANSQDSNHNHNNNVNTQDIGSSLSAQQYPAPSSPPASARRSPASSPFATPTRQRRKMNSISSSPITPGSSQKPARVTRLHIRQNTPLTGAGSAFSVSPQVSRASQNRAQTPMAAAISAATVQPMHARSMSDTTAIFSEYKSTSLNNSGHNHVYSDRFIPSRSASNIENALQDIQHESSAAAGGAGSAAITAASASTTPAQSRGAAIRGTESDSKEALRTYNNLLRSELLDSVPHGSSPAQQGSSTPRTSASTGSTPRQRTFRYQSPKKVTPKQSPYSSSPVIGNFQMMPSPRKAPRKIAKHPFKILDAPALKDDFYLNLVDWSSQNVLAVGLGGCVYLWSAASSKVTKLCDLPDTSITSVAWTQHGTHLAVGTETGNVDIWDAVRCRKVRTLSRHSRRVGTLAWSHKLLASGGRDNHIIISDPRTDEKVTVLAGHRQEVCGLRWSFDDGMLASGGNDNRLLVWDMKKASNKPLHRFTQHCAAVKAIAWSPHQHGLLASGGGTADRCIRFWNTLNGNMMNVVDTGSQVCNLWWAKSVNEVVSTHGYSLNQIIVWKYPTMQQLATLTGHTYRVLYLAASPDGQVIVTGAGDETLRFWNVFPSSKSHSSTHGGKLFFPSATNIR
jgi:cell division cycle 20-like protein 1, cofactor of APC complex